MTMELNREQRDLVERYMYLVVPSARKWSSKFHIDYNDTFQVGCIGLISGVQCGNIENPFFEHYLLKSIKYSILELVTKVVDDRKRKILSIDDLYGEEAKSKLLISQTKKTLLAELMEILEVEVNKLKRSQDIMIAKLLFGLNKSREILPSAEVARQLGVTRECVRHRKDLMLRILKRRVKARLGEDINDILT